MRRLMGGICVLVMVLCAASVAMAQAPPQQPPTYEQAAQRSWEGVHRKIFDMVKDYPEDKYNAHPGDDTRDFLAEIRHVMVAMDLLTANLKGEQFNNQERAKYYEGRPATKASLSADFETALNATVEQMKNGVSPRLISLAEHAGEHYGKLVSIYRLGGLVPPTTRAAQERQRQAGKQPGKN